jgi:hypothetical protein
MTDDQINAVIAEVCGWTNVHPANRSGKAPGTDYTSNYEHILNYCADLNAMHEAEKMLRNGRNYEYLHQLERVALSHMAYATAHQRAEAFLRTLGKWEEAK